jgi:hypothetical protein
VNGKKAQLPLYKIQVHRKLIRNTENENEKAPWPHLSEVDTIGSTSAAQGEVGWEQQSRSFFGDGTLVFQRDTRSFWMAALKSPYGIMILQKVEIDILKIPWFCNVEIRIIKALFVTFKRSEAYSIFCTFPSGSTGQWTWGIDEKTQAASVTIIIVLRSPQQTLLQSKNQCVRRWP